MQSVIHHPEKLVSANGLELNYDSFGEPHPPVILLIMGLATQMIHWDETFCRMLACKGYRVIRFDNRDIGKSTWLKDTVPPSNMALLANALFNRPVGASYLLDDMADDTLALLDVLQIEQANIVGASMGGMIAQSIAIKAPHRLKSLTSIMSTTGDRSLPKASTAFSMKLLKAPPKTIELAIPFALDLWKSFHGTYYDFDQKKIINLIKRARQRGFNPSGNKRQLGAIVDSQDRTQSLKKVTVPSLIIHGESDPLVPVACGYATANAIPNAKLKTYPGMGHTFPNALHQDIADNILAHIGSAVA
jgi:pimeloyl-ACP methyl ester carboxylesterase